MGFVEEHARLQVSNLLDPVVDTSVYVMMVVCNILKFKCTLVQINV